MNAAQCFGQRFPLANLWLTALLFLTLGAQSCALYEEMAPLEEPSSVHSLSITPSSSSLEPGQSAQLSASALNREGEPVETPKISWISDDPQIAEVDEQGLVQAIAVGDVTISARVQGVSATAKIQVISPIKRIEVTPSPLTLSVGFQEQLSAHIYDHDDEVLSGHEVDWSSSDTDIVTVNADGKVTGVARGRATIRARAGGVTGTASVSVKKPVASIEITPEQANIEVAEELELNARVLDVDGEVDPARVVRWESSRAEVATVNEQGVVTGEAPGTVEIIATSEDISATSVITVTNSVSEITISPNDPIIEVTDVLNLSARATNSQGAPVPGVTIRWESEDPMVAEVEQNGDVLGIGGGTATITARAAGHTASVSLQVLDPVRSVIVDPVQKTVEVTDTVQLRAEAQDKGGNPLNPDTIEWSSADAQIASVDQDGKVTTHAGGSVEITATIDGVEGSAEITVEAPARSLSLSPDPISPAVGSSATITAEVLDRGGNPVSGYQVDWASADPEIATVTSTGPMSAEVRAVSGGSTTITATVSLNANDTLEASAEVNAGSAVASIEITPDHLSLFPEDQGQLDVSVRDTQGNPLSGRTIHWSSEDSDIATVSTSGLVTAIAPGTTQITATSEGITDTARVDVVRWKHLSIGQHFSCGVLSDGAAYCWGQNNIFGVLGNGSIDSGPDNQHLNHDADAHQPTRVDTTARFDLLNVGFFHACGLTDSGKAYCWGAGGAGHLGDGQHTSSSTPVAVSGNYTFVDIQIGVNHTCALDTQQHVYCWGYNVEGQAGQGSSGASSYSAPQRITDHRFTALTVGADHSCAIDTDGQTLCWGVGDVGQLGNGSLNDRPAPTAVDTDQTFIAIAAGFDHTCALNDHGEIFCWGGNDHGGLGDGSTDPSPVPVQIQGSREYRGLAAGAGSTCAGTADLDVYCWGFNGQGNLGSGTVQSTQLTPTLITGGYQWQLITMGLQHTCGLARGDAGAYCWGDNDWGQLGNGTTQNYLSIPTAVVNP